MTVPFKTHSASSETHPADPARGGRARSRFWLLEWAAGLFAFALAFAAMLLFVMNTIANRVDTLIEQQNTAALKLSDNLQYFRDHRKLDDVSIPPGLFSDLVEFSRNTVTIMLEAHRLGDLESLSTFGLARKNPDQEGKQSDKSWSEKLLDTLTPKNGRKEKFDHTGVDPRTTSGEIFDAGAYQTDLYQSLRDFSQERCTSYKDVGGAISIYLFPLLYALLGAFLCDLRCRLTRAPREARQPASLGSAHYATAMIAGAVLGMFTSLIPTSLSLPPLLIAFLLGYSVDIFIARLDALIDKLRAPDLPT